MNMGKAVAKPLSINKDFVDEYLTIEHIVHPLQIKQFKFVN